MFAQHLAAHNFSLLHVFIVETNGVVKVLVKFGNYICGCAIVTLHHAFE